MTQLTKLEQMVNEDTSVEQLNEKIEKIRSISSEVIETVPQQEKYTFYTLTEIETKLQIDLNQIPEVYAKCTNVLNVRQEKGILVVLTNKCSK